MNTDALLLDKTRGCLGGAVGDALGSPGAWRGRRPSGGCWRRAREGMRDETAETRRRGGATAVVAAARR